MKRILHTKRGIISETYERPDKSYFKEPSELKDLIDTTKLVKISTKTNRYRQDLRHHKEISTKRYTFTHYYQRNSSRLLNQSLLQRPLVVLSTKQVTKQEKCHTQSRNLSRRFILLDSLLFKLVIMPDRETVLLAVPEVCADKIIMLYQTCLFARHQGVIKTYLTINDNFFNPGLMHYLRSYIKGCHTYQLVRVDKLPMRQLQTRIYLNYRPLSRLSMDLKVMPRLQKGHRFILCIIDEVTNYFITAPYITQSQKK